MSMVDALYWERTLKADGWLIPDPENDGWLITKPEYIERYGREALSDYWFKEGNLERAYDILLEGE